MQAEIFRKVQPTEFYRKFLEHEIRPDGRVPADCRTTALDVGSIGTAWGSALVRQGNTAVLCAINAEYAEPKEDSPTAGFVVPTVHMSPLCSPDIRRGPAGERAHQLTVFVTNMVQRCGLVDSTQLCVSAGRVVWALYCDLTVLDSDGALEDVCLLALTAALANLRLPRVQVDSEDEDAVPVPSADRPTALTVNVPCALCFAVFDGQHVLADPTDEEQNVGSASVTVVVTSTNQLAAVTKNGPTPLDEAKLRHCISLAKQRAKQIKRLVAEHSSQ
eukprot:comp51419_c0_seq1/m.47661 comp51419_c0_seq1/g.47661  ORF comp51419_c0_seq1/g.47661 comp51419_c0_seq1/m.47661 type:complete len:275 (-) comp51419_c0_seq1:229-1053(-)